MEYRKFGSTPERVSVIGFGAASLSGSGGGYGFGLIEDEEAIKLVQAALGQGINLYDTAPIYGFGESERRLGLALEGRRDDAFLVSKCGVAFNEYKQVKIDNSRTTTEQMLQNSLRRLKTDMIDLYFVHWPDPHTDIRATMETLVRAQEAGLIRYIGLSNTNEEELLKAEEIGTVDAVQFEASFLNPVALDRLLETRTLSNMGVMTWGTLAKGILTGTVTPDRTFEETDVRSSAPWWINADHGPSFEVMTRLRPLFEESGHTGLELALAYLLGRDCVDTLLCGVKNEAQLMGVIEALNHRPDPTFVERAVEIRDTV